MADSPPAAGAARRRTRRLRLALFASTAALMIGFVLTAYVADVLEGPELDTIDARFSIRGSEGAPDGIVFVAIDDVTFDELDRPWPLPRRLHARAIDRLRAAGARVIAYDVQFTEPTNPRDDNALIDAIDRAHNVVLATTEVDSRGGTKVLGGGKLLRQIGARPASANYVTDSDGVIRRARGEIDGLVTFGVAAAEEARDGRLKRPHGSEWIDYRGPPGTIETVPFSRLVSGREPAATFRDKIVVVGAAAPSLQDLHTTSASKDEPMAGPELQANTIDTVLRGFPLQEVPAAVTIALIVLFGMFGPGVALAFGPLRAALSGAALGAVYAIVVQLAFNGGMILPFTYPTASLVLGAFAGLIVALVMNAFDRQRVRDLFSRFVPEPVVDQVLENVDDDLRLGGQRRVATVVFSDARGFTAFSESREPEVVIEVLNRYLTTMTDVLLAHGGTIVAFMGDGIMAVFGAPIETEDHADRALAAACEMTGSALDDFNDWMRASGHGDGFRIGVGLNSGAVISGNVGSERRLEYTVIGDTTNTASRLESMTKATPYMVLLSDSTRALLSDDATELRYVDALEVRGRLAKVVVWAVDPDAPAAPAPAEPPAQGRAR